MLDAKRTLISLNRLAARSPEGLAWIEQLLIVDLKALAPTAVEVAIEEGEPMGLALTAAIRAQPDPLTSCNLLFALPDQTVVLKELALEVTTRAVVAFKDFRRALSKCKSDEELRLRLTHPPEPPALGLGNFGWSFPRLQDILEREDLRRCWNLLSLAILAELLLRLSTRLHHSARAVEALDTAKKAARIQARVARDLIDVADPSSAQSLRLLAGRFHAVGRHDEALNRAQDATRMFAALASEYPGDAWTEHALMWSLNDLACILCELTRHEEATRRCKEAIAVCERHEARHPVFFKGARPQLLLNLCGMLNMRGLWEEALVAGEEAVALFQRLSQEQPDAWQHRWAQALTSLLKPLAHLGRLDEALPRAEQAFQIFERLAQAGRTEFESSRAQSLFYLSTLLHSVGRLEDALEKALAASRLYEELSTQDPGRHEESWGNSLSNVSWIYKSLGRWEEAITFLRRAIEIYDRVAARSSGHLAEHVVNLKHNLVLLLSEQAQHCQGGTSSTGHGLFCAGQ